MYNSPNLDFSSLSPGPAFPVVEKPISDLKDF